MQRIFCDIKGCGAEIDPCQGGETIQIGNIEFDLCETCFRKMEKWAAGALNGGTKVEDDNEETKTPEFHGSPWIVTTDNTAGNGWLAIPNSTAIVETFPLTIPNTFPTLSGVSYHFPTGETTNGQ